MKVSYISAALDNSGYADAGRNNMAALLSVGVGVEAVVLSFEQFKSDHGQLGKRIVGLMTPKANCDIQIIHTTPNVFPSYIDKRKYNVGYTTWEATSLPTLWVEYINQMDEIWVPCSQNVEIFRASGITKPIYLIPHAIDVSVFKDASKLSILDNLADDEFAFYSIFQWTERKNPLALLKAYLTEFTSSDKVCLVLKTYLLNPSSPQEKEKIKQTIAEIKAKLYLKDYPKILLISSILSRDQISSLHSEGDCYLSFHRNEGFGIPIAEAMLMGKPVITTRYGGPLDFVNNNTAFTCGYQLTPCYGMPWDSYNGKMTWAEIDIMEAKQKMRYVFENREPAKEVASVAQKNILTNYSWERIGTLMKLRLEEIERSRKQ